ncbi:MAG TPA: hypothetical protein VJ183_02945 [Chloroflexia bacterium]|nr:hypothetical protein [Chloroflexia bacterium]
MSLTSHIRQGSKSPIGRFFLERFPQVPNMTKQINPQLRSASTLRLADHTPSHVYGTLGTAIDYRIRYYFAVTPSERLKARQGADNLVLWVMYDTEGEVDIDPVWELVHSFFESLDATLAEIQPAGRRLEVKEEQVLARYCYVLALFDILGRAGWTPDSPFTGIALALAEKKSVEELLAIPQVELVEDLCAMSRLFYDKCAHLLSQTAVLNLNPNFAGSADIGGADADLIVDGCLIEVKTNIQPMMKPEHLRQLAGYLLLDYDDDFDIRTVGIYMARQGLLLRWSVEQFLRLLTGDPFASVTALRRDFRTRCSEWLATLDDQSSQQTLGEQNLEPVTA